MLNTNNNKKESNVIEYRIRDASQNNKIIGFVKSESLLLALQKTAFATGIDITQLFAEPIKEAA